VSDTFNPECTNCKITIGRIEKWIDHVNCPPKKWQRYNNLVEFVKMIANKSIETNVDLQNRKTIAWINQAATNLLKELNQ
jgi:hypothetical protein